MFFYGLPEDLITKDMKDVNRIQIFFDITPPRAHGNDLLNLTSTKKNYSVSQTYTSIKILALCQFNH